MTFHDLFHDFSEFSMAKVKPFFSWQYQNNHLFNILHLYFPALQSIKCVLVYLSTEIKFHDFPGLEIEITNSMTSIFSITCMNPEQELNWSKIHTGPYNAGIESVWYLAEN